MSDVTVTGKVNFEAEICCLYFSILENHIIAILSGILAHMASSVSFQLLQPDIPVLA